MLETALGQNKQLLKSTDETLRPDFDANALDNDNFFLHAEIQRAYRIHLTHLWSKTDF